MRFWDSSAVIPLLVREPWSDQVRGLIDRDEELAIWWSTPVECWSAVSRRRRDAEITAEAADLAYQHLELLRSVWHEVLPSDEVRRQARRLLNTHSLRAADALQLAAAIIWSGSYGEGELVTFDSALREAARLEGFLVI